MRCVDGSSWNNERADFVSRFLQVSTHLLEYQSSVPSKEAANVLAQDEGRTALPDDSKHFWPEMAVVFRASPSSSRAEGLTREASCNEVNTVARPSPAFTPFRL